MMEETKKPIQRIEDIFKITHKLTDCGYQSVFDITRQSRSAFIQKHKDGLGSSVGDVYDLSVGYANQISRLFRKNKVASGLNNALQNKKLKRTKNNLQALMKNGPTYQKLFNDDWNSYCPNGAIEAVDSPVSYLSWLYKQATDFEAQSGGDGIIPLATRRQDLPNLNLDDSAVNQVIPALQLVNEILEQSVEPYIESLHKADASLPDTVDETLAVTRYPSLLPFHYPHDQTKLALEGNDETLLDVIQQVDVAWPYFSKTNLFSASAEAALEMGSDLAPEQQAILTELADQTDLLDFYTKNFGLAANSYSVLSGLDVFTQQVGITVPQFEQLIASIRNSTSVVVSPNYIPGTTILSEPNNYGAVYINNNTSPAITLSNDVNAIEFSGLTAASIISDTAPFGNAIVLDSSLKQYAYIDDDFTTSGTSGKNFTMGCWLKIKSTPNGDVMIAGNTNVGSSQNADYGYFILGSENKLWLSICDTHGHIDDDKTISYEYDTWCYYIFSVDWINKQVNICCNTRNSTTPQTSCLSLDSALQDSLPGNSYWVFNEQENFNYYASHSRNATVTFNDISIWDKALTAAELTTIATSNQVSGGRSDMLHYYPLENADTDIKNLSDDRMSRINRLTRLQRWLQLPYDQVDLLVSSANPNLTTNINTLRMLGVFRHYQQKYSVDAYQFSAVLMQITPYAISPNIPFFDQVFNNPSLFEEPFSITNAVFDYTVKTGADARIVKQICAGLDINEAQFSLLADAIVTATAGTKNKLTCSLATVSALYRLVMVPRWLGLSYSDGLALLKIIGNGSGITQFATTPVLAALDATTGQPTASDILDTLMAMANAAEWIQKNMLSASSCFALLRSGENVSLATTADVNFINDINQQLPIALLNESSFAFMGVPSTEYNDLQIYSSYTAADTIPGVGQGVQLDAAQQQYGVFTDRANTIASGLSDFTIGAWVKLPKTVSGNTSIFSNATLDAEDNNLDRGCYILARPDGCLSFGIHDDKQEGIEDAATLKYTANHWAYLTLTMDITNKKVTLMSSPEDGQAPTKKQLDFSSLSGNILPPEGNRWALNQDGSLAFYTTFPEQTDTVCYCDITLWNSVLSDTQISTIVNAKVPATKTVPAEVFDNTIIDFTWMDKLSDLVDDSGLVYPVAANMGETVYDALYRCVYSDFEGTDFTSPMTLEEITNTVATVLYQAKQSQDGIANSAIAKDFLVDHSLPPFLLQWAGSSDYGLLSATLAQGDVSDPSDISSNYMQLLYQVARRSLVAKQFGISPAMLHSFLSHPGWFGLPDSDITLPLLYLFSRYADWLKLTPKEDAVLAYLSWVNGTSAPAVTAVQAAQALAALLSWDSSEVQIAAEHANPTDKIAKTLDQVDTVMRLQALSTQTGAAVTPLINVGALTVNSTYDNWQQVGESLVATQA
jgi:hypothetical protein